MKDSLRTPYCLVAKWISQFHSNLRFDLEAKQSIVITSFATMTFVQVCFLRCHCVSVNHQCAVFHSNSNETEAVLMEIMSVGEESKIKNINCQKTVTTIDYLAARSKHRSLWKCEIHFAIGQICLPFMPENDLLFWPRTSFSKILWCASNNFFFSCLLKCMITEFYVSKLHTTLKQTILNQHWLLTSHTSNTV